MKSPLLTAWPPGIGTLEDIETRSGGPLLQVKSRLANGVVSTLKLVAPGRPTVYLPGFESNWLMVCEAQIFCRRVSRKQDLVRLWD